MGISWAHQNKIKGTICKNSSLFPSKALVFNSPNYPYKSKRSKIPHNVSLFHLLTDQLNRTSFTVHRIPSLILSNPV